MRVLVLLRVLEKMLRALKLEIMSSPYTQLNVVSVNSVKVEKLIYVRPFESLRARV